MLKNTENLIKEAEGIFKKSEEKSFQNITKEIQQEKFEPLKEKNKTEIIQVINKDDIDPIETMEWLDLYPQLLIKMEIKEHII